VLEIIDRCALMPRNFSVESWLHFDHNPWHEGIVFCRFQGMLILTNHNNNSRGLEYVKDFTPEMFAQWADLHKPTSDCVQPVVPCPDLKSKVQGLYAKTGTLIIWDSRTPHGGFGGVEERATLYFTFHPSKNVPCDVMKRHKRIPSST